MTQRGQLKSTQHFGVCMEGRSRSLFTCTIDTAEIYPLASVCNDPGHGFCIPFYPTGVRLMSEDARRGCRAATRPFFGRTCTFPWRRIPLPLVVEGARLQAAVTAWSSGWLFETPASVPCLCCASALSPKAGRHRRKIEGHRGREGCPPPQT